MSYYYCAGIQDQALPHRPAPAPAAVVEDRSWLPWLLVGAGGLGLAYFALRTPPTTRERHDRKVVSVAKRFARHGYNVDADVKGWTKPQIMNGRRADVVAVRGRDRRVIEIEHEHTLTTSHTRGQIADLEDYCAKARCRFLIELT